MNRVFAGALIATALALAFSACDDGLSGSVSEPSTDCSAYASCDSCTPVLGCGWCSGPGGAGVCASDPDDCPTQQFSWTWDMSGCRVAADASVVPGDDADVHVVVDAAADDEGDRDAAPQADGSRLANDASGD